MGAGLSCPVCGTEFDVGTLFANAADQAALARLASVSVPLGARVMQYITLFQPPKTRLTMPKKVKLILQLLPDLERGAINHKGRDWAISPEVWGMAIDQMLAARHAGRLELPMTGHGYLYSILAGMADKHEGRAEQQHEAAKRTPATQGTVEVRGQTMSIGQGLAQVFGGRDPALAKIDADRSAAAPMPESVRERIAAIKKGASK